jgi:hypothetical protein
VVWVCYNCLFQHYQQRQHAQRHQRVRAKGIVQSFVRMCSARVFCSRFSVCCGSISLFAVRHGGDRQDAQRAADHPRRKNKKKKNGSFVVLSFTQCRHPDLARITISNTNTKFEFARANQCASFALGRPAGDTGVALASNSRTTC